MERVVAGYRLERRLGKGAMGEVWLGRHTDTGGIGAVKMLREDVRDRVEQLFARERRAIARLHHPNIVALYDVGPDHLVTAYVHGADLMHRMRAPIEPQLALRITRQIASALEHAHASGVVHRDIKPSNILLDEDDHAFLADFGVARIVDEEVQDVGAGTPAFMAPEQARGDLATPASDQYSLARTLLAMLAGDRLPQDPAAALALLPATLPKELHAILWRATSLHPADRYPSVTGFAAALDTVDLSGSAATLARLPLRRDTRGFEWCARPGRATRCGPDLERADHRLSQHFEIADFRRETGLDDVGWAMWAQSGRLGPLTSPEALARASEIVVLIHGFMGTRDSWEGVARSICRDNGHTVVLVPDCFGFGESRFAGVPTVEQAGPAGMLRAIRAWLGRLGLAEVPTVLVGHSAGAAAVLSATDEELGPLIHRVAVTPFFPFVHAQQRFALQLLGLLVKMIGWWKPLYRRLARAITNTREMRARYAVADRERLRRLLCEMDPRVMSRLCSASVSARPATGDQLERCLLVVTPDDPLLPEEIVKRALHQLGFPGDKVHRLASGGHFPHAESEEHPEWTNRNIDDMVGVIDAVLDLTRHQTTGTETVRSSPRAIHWRSTATVTMRA